MEDACHREVIRLHEVIEQWLTGQLPRTEKAFAGFRQALAEDFHIISPTGTIQDKTAVTAGFWRAHGLRAAPFRVEIRNYTNRFVSKSECLATYEEWQHDEHETTARLSTVFFRRSSSHLGVEWVHLHETWIPSA